MYLFSDPLLKYTSIESVLIETIIPSIAIPHILSSIRNSASHKEVSAGLSRLYLFAVASWRSSDSCLRELKLWWGKAELHRFIRVLPSCTEDYRLLIHCLQVFTNLEFSPPFIGRHTLDVRRNLKPFFLNRLFLLLQMWGFLTLTCLSVLSFSKEISSTRCFGETLESIFVY